MMHYLLVARWTVAVAELCSQEEQQVYYQPLDTQDQEEEEDEKQVYYQPLDNQEEKEEEEGVESLLLHTLPLKGWNRFIPDMNVRYHDMQAGRKKLDVAEKYQCKPVLLRLSLAGNLEKTHLCSSMGPNGGSVAMDSEVDSSVVSPGGRKPWWP
jgi:hypothetical protein